MKITKMKVSTCKVTSAKVTDNKVTNSIGSGSGDKRPTNEGKEIKPSV